MKKTMIKQIGILAAASLFCAVITGVRQETVLADAGNGSGAAAGKLSDEACREYTAFINDPSCYGFLLSEYTDPAYADLNEVFHDGCGASEPMTEEEAGELRRDFETDVTKLRTTTINEILKARTGLTLDQTARPFPWEYSEKFDFYYMEHGDTNVRSFTVTGGQWNDNLLELDCMTDHRQGSSLTCRTVLQTTDSLHNRVADLRFVSNRFTGKAANPASGLPVYGNLYAKINFWEEAEDYYKADCTLYDSGFFSKKDFDALKPGDTVTFTDHEVQEGVPCPDEGTVTAKNEDGSLTVEGTGAEATYLLTPEKCTADSGWTYYMRVLRDHACVRIPKYLSVDPAGISGHDLSAGISMEQFLNEGWKLGTAFSGTEGDVIAELRDYIGNYWWD